LVYWLCGNPGKRLSAGRKWHTASEWNFRLPGHAGDSLQLVPGSIVRTAGPPGANQYRLRQQQLRGFFSVGNAEFADSDSRRQHELYDNGDISARVPQHGRPECIRFAERSDRELQSGFDQRRLRLFDPDSINFEFDAHRYSPSHD